jgi:hypothetical protein
LYKVGRFVLLTRSCDSFTEAKSFFPSSHAQFKDVTLFVAASRVADAEVEDTPVSGVSTRLESSEDESSFDWLCRVLLQHLQSQIGVQTTASSTESRPSNAHTMAAQQ